MQPYYESDGVTIYHGDCLDVMRELPDNSIDTVITDPPYGLSDKSGESISNSILNGLLDIILPNLDEINPELAKQVDLHGVPFGGSDLRRREISSIIESWVCVPVGPVDLNGDIKTGDEEVEACDISPSCGVPDTILVNGINTDTGQFIGDFILDFRHAGEFTGRNGGGGFMPELFFGGFSVPVSPVFFPGDRCPFAPLCMPSASLGSDSVRDGDDSLCQPDSAPLIMALAGAINTFMLRFDFRGGTLELFTTYRASQRDASAELFRPKLVRAGATTSRLPAEFEAVRVSLIDFPTNGTNTFYFHLWLHKDWISRFNSIIPRGGFMGKSWDAVTPEAEIWRESLRVLKPGGTALVFGGTRTFHRTMLALEDAGWELRDVIMWVYGSGFPKAYDISKGIDKYFDADDNSATGEPYMSPATVQAQTWDGYKTALKPAWEPIIIAMKPLDGTFVNNALAWGVAGLNIDECRVPSNEITGWGGNGSNGYGSCFNSGDPRPVKGRYPANLIHDGSEEVMELFPDTNQGSAARYFYCAKASRSERDAGLNLEPAERSGVYNFRVDGSLDGKPTLSKRNTHPTVKPLKLMQYLARLTKTPTGGIVLDPFMGSGTTGIACILEGRQFIGIDMNAEYCEIAKQRIAYHQEHARQLALIT